MIRMIIILMTIAVKYLQGWLCMHIRPIVHLTSPLSADDQHTSWWSAYIKMMSIHQDDQHSSSWALYIKMISTSTSRWSAYIKMISIHQDEQHLSSWTLYIKMISTSTSRWSAYINLMIKGFHTMMILLFAIWIHDHDIGWLWKFTK